MLPLLGAAGCRHNVNTSNPAVVQASALADAANTCKLLEDGVASANAAVEKLETAEPDYYAHVKPLLQKVSAANVLAIEKIQVVKNGGTADWKGALVNVAASVSPSDLTSVGVKNQTSQVIMEGSIAALVATLESFKAKFGAP
jgi:hypothetical protein